LAWRPLPQFTGTTGKKKGTLQAEPEGAQAIAAAIVRLSGAQTSPLWLRLALAQLGYRSHGLLVDVTNYVMEITGQPLHAFDLRSVATEGGATLGAEAIKKPMRLTTLEGVERELLPGDIVMTDVHGQPLDLAGVKGGLDSSVKPDTEEVVLQASVFHGAAIRRSSRRLGLRTDGSGRQEKGPDPFSVEMALRYALALLVAEGATVESPVAHQRTISSKKLQGPITVQYAQSERLLGVRIAPPEVKRILEDLGFAVSTATKAMITVTPPTWRQDVQLPEDVIEEYVRIWGYDRVPATIPDGSMLAPRRNQHETRLQWTRRLLAGQGYVECVNQIFVSEQDLTRSGYQAKDALLLANPLSRETAYMAPSHVPLLLRTVSEAGWRDYTHTALAEIGAVFTSAGQEEQRITLLLRGEGSAEALLQSLQGHVQLMARQMNQAVTWQETASVQPFAAQSGEYRLVGGEVIGSYSVVHPRWIQKWKIRRATSVVVAELRTNWLTAQLSHTQYQSIPDKTPMERDCTFNLPENEAVGSWIAALALPRHAEKVECVSIYRQPKQNTKAVTLRLTFNHPEDRTLTDAEVNELIKEFTASVTL